MYFSIVRDLSLSYLLSYSYLLPLHSASVPINSAHAWSRIRNSCSASFNYYGSNRGVRGVTLVERQKHDDRVSRLRIMSASLIARQLCRRDLDPIYAITVDRIAVSITIRTSPRSSSLVIFIFPIFTTVYVAISTRLFNHHFSYSFYFFFVILFSNFLLCNAPRWKSQERIVDFPLR